LQIIEATGIFPVDYQTWCKQSAKKFGAFPADLNAIYVFIILFWFLYVPSLMMYKNIAI